MWNYGYPAVEVKDRLVWLFLSIHPFHVVQTTKVESRARACRFG